MAFKSYEDTIRNRRGDELSESELANHKQNLSLWENEISNNLYLNHFRLPDALGFSSEQLYLKAISIRYEWKKALERGSMEAEGSDSDGQIFRSLSQKLTENNFFVNAVLYEISLFLLNSGLVHLSFELPGEWPDPSREAERIPIESVDGTIEELKSLLEHANSYQLISPDTFRRVISDINVNRESYHYNISDHVDDLVVGDPIYEPLTETDKGIRLKLLHRNSDLIHFFRSAFRLAMLLRHAVPDLEINQKKASLVIVKLALSFCYKVKPGTLRKAIGPGYLDEDVLKTNFAQDYEIAIINIGKESSSSVEANKDVSLLHMIGFVSKFNANQEIELFKNK
jgi:hypothetical protein